MRGNFTLSICIVYLLIVQLYIVSKTRIKINKKLREFVGRGRHESL